MLDQHIATQKRLTYVWTKWSYETLATWIIWYLTPVSENNTSVWLERFWQARKFETETPFAVKETDILTIDDVDYQVKSFARFKWIVIDRMRVFLTLPKNP